MWLKAGPDQPEARYSEYLELDLSTVVPSISGPKRPQERIILTESKAQFREDLRNYVKVDLADGSLDEAIDESFPASDSPSFTASATHLSEVAPHGHGPKANGRPSKTVAVKTADGREFELDHGAVSIASITSCTNTSNPSVMLAAALLARNAVDKGLTSKPWVKTSVAPGSKVVTDYYNKSGLTPYLEKL